MALCEEKYKLIHIFNGSIEIFWGGLVSRTSIESCVKALIGLAIVLV